MSAINASVNASTSSGSRLVTRLPSVTAGSSTTVAPAFARSVRIDRQQVALEKGLPVELVDRLRGDTEDDLAEDADRLLALIGTPRKPAPDPTQGGRGAAPTRSGDVFAEFFEGRLNTP